MKHSPIRSDQKDPLWFKDAIIYELHIKAFHDSNADGIGDFEGLIERLDYVQELGVTAIWLLPFYPSPQRDGGYDISDYYAINPDYGTIAQFQQLMEEAHARDLQVITELVINHTSDQHPWFQRARRAEPGTPERDFYVWSDNTDKYADARIIFQDFEQSNWTWDPVAKSYYWHRFYSHQPDLNYDHPEVHKEVFRIIDFWCDLGVDGFRLDAVPYLFEREGTNCENLPPTHQFLKELRSHVDDKYPGVMMLAEANMWPEDSASYFGDGDECHMNYHFPVMPRMFMALKMEDRHPITDIIDQTPAIPDNCQWALFLRNHDELTLEMVTDEERDYMYRAYNKDTLSRINLGIRHRLAPLLDNHRQKIELMNILLFSLPGTPVIYYGDEIGMGDNVHLGDRDGVRTPMQWSPDRNAGFSRSHPHQLYLPLINDPEYHFETVNVETQQNNPSSLFWWMKRTLTVRKRYQAFGRGNIEFLHPDNAKVLAFLRIYGDETILVLANLSRHSQSAELELPDHQHTRPVEVFGKTAFPQISPGLNRFTLGPYGYYWFELQKTHSSEQEPAPIPAVNWSHEYWTNVWTRKERQTEVTTILTRFMEHHPGFHLKDKVIETVQVVQALDLHLPPRQAAWLVVKVQFTEGLPEQYSVPVVARKSLREGELPDTSVLARLRQGEESLWLIDGMADGHFLSLLLQQMVESPNGWPTGMQVHVHEELTALPEVPVGRWHDRANGFVSLSFGNQFFLKLYRRIEHGANPDTEINRLPQLREHLVPGTLAELQVSSRRKQPLTLAQLQPYVPNQGRANQVFYDTSRRLLEYAETELHLNGDAPGMKQIAEQLGDMTVPRASVLGRDLGMLHRSLMQQQAPGFVPEAFSLHYQRSVFAALQSLVRSAWKKLSAQAKDRRGLEPLVQARKPLLESLKQIYRHKFEAYKIRIHGNLTLPNILFTGKEFCFYNFLGPEGQAFSESRLKKSPARDIATLMLSLGETEAKALADHVADDVERMHSLVPYLMRWHRVFTRAFLEGYFSETEGLKLLPEDPDDRVILLNTFLVQRALRMIETLPVGSAGWYAAQLELKRQARVDMVPALENRNG